MAVDMELVKLAVDGYHGKVEKYSTADSQEALRKALVEMNGGSTKLDYKKIRSGEYAEMFALVEEILGRTVVEGLMNDDFFMQMVDFRNVALGDEPVFVIEKGHLFTVSEMADGTQGIRRQRIEDKEEKTIKTSLHGVKIYEELNRVLAGRVDFNDMIAKVAESMKQSLLEEIYALWNSATQDDFGDAVYFPVAGDFDEDTLLDVIAHVEASANGQTATIVGTKKALRSLAPAIQGADSKSDLYNMGFYGKYYGANVVALPQRHKLDSTQFVMRDDVLIIVANPDKPIKVVYEGDPLIIPGDPLANGDLTFEYLFAERYGMAIVLAGDNAGIGRYEFT